MAVYKVPIDTDTYIDSQKITWQKTVLKELRSTVHNSDKDIGEAIKWSAPYFMYGDIPIAWMFCARDWVHFSFLEGALLDHSHGLFVETDNKKARTIKIHENEKVPVAVISKLVKEAVANAKSGRRVKLRRPKPGSQEFDLPHEYELWLKETGMLTDYLQRPFYQQRGWIEWIEQAKSLPTKQKRMRMVLVELKHGQYMPNASDRFKE